MQRTNATHERSAHMQHTKNIGQMQLSVIIIDVEPTAIHAVMLTALCSFR
jgi:hypothetical protein